ncbi:MAG: sulfotransferase family 2 domain-containing protein [Ideonella sp.]|nr:sulfotransferase family 2 domain-containing protein [Ideonella sp.]
MAVYSETLRYLFLASPQTGSKAIKKTLIEQFQGKQIPETGKHKNGKQVLKKHHTTLKMLLNSELLTQAQIDQAFKFTGVRNPFDLLVSRYMKHRARHTSQSEDPDWARQNPDLAARAKQAFDLPFPEWVQAVHADVVAADRDFKGPLLYLEGADYVIRFERLQEGFDEVLRKIGVEGQHVVAPYNVTTERVEGSQKKDYRELYDDASKALVQKLYGPVLDRFGYSFEGG